MPVWTCGEKKVKDFWSSLLASSQGSTQTLNSQGLQSCHLRAAGSVCSFIQPTERGGSAKRTHIHKHTEESELKPQHKENKDSRDQRGQRAA